MKEYPELVDFLVNIINLLFAVIGLAVATLLSSELYEPFEEVTILNVFGVVLAFSMLVVFSRPLAYLFVEKILKFRKT